MQWVRDKIQRNRVILAHCNDTHWNQTQEYIRDTKKWCRENKIMFWNDTTYTMKFTSEKDLSWFLLRWS